MNYRQAVQAEIQRSLALKQKQKDESVRMRKEQATLRQALSS